MILHIVICSENYTVKSFYVGNIHLDIALHITYLVFLILIYMAFLHLVAFPGSPPLWSASFFSFSPHVSYLSLLSVAGPLCFFRTFIYFL